LDNISDGIGSIEFYSNEHPLKFVTTKNGEIPSELNSEPLCTIKPDRGCLVFFNPATFFYPLATGYITLDEAGEAGVSRALDFEMGAQSSFGSISPNLHSRVPQTSTAQVF